MCLWMKGETEKVKGAQLRRETSEDTVEIQTWVKVGQHGPVLSMAKRFSGDTECWRTAACRNPHSKPAVVSHLLTLCHPEHHFVSLLIVS